MTPLEPQQPVTVTLIANDWNFVLGALAEAPYRLASPVISQIMRQIEATQAEPLPRPNGAGEAHADAAEG